MNDIEDLIRSDLQEYMPYLSARKEGVSGDIFLNANEMPWASDSIIPEINRYPEPQPFKLLEKFAQIYQVDHSQLLLSRGSDESIDLLVRLFCNARKDAIMICPPTFGMYSTCAQLQGAKVIEVPLLKEKGFQLDVAGILNAWKPCIKILFLCSPNNPTGNLLDQEDILFICKSLSGKCLVVVDEAYIEFSDAESLAKKTNKIRNLVVLRTFSKAYGLAGIRCGVAIASESIIGWLRNIIAPYPIPCSTSLIVDQALNEKSFYNMQDHITCIRTQRQWLSNRFVEFNYIEKVWPSDANFILVEVRNSRLLINFFKDSGIVIRDLTARAHLYNCIRISIGTPDENRILIMKLSSYRLKYHE